MRCRCKRSILDPSDGSDDDDDDSQKGEEVTQPIRAEVPITMVNSSEGNEAQTATDTASKQLPRDPSLDEDGNMSEDYGRGSMDMQQAIEASLAASNTNAQTTADNLYMA